VTPEQLAAWKEQRHIVLHESWLELQKRRAEAVKRGEHPQEFLQQAGRETAVNQAKHLDPETRQRLDVLLKYVNDHQRRQMAATGDGDRVSRFQKQFVDASVDKKLIHIRAMLERQEQATLKILDRLDRVETEVIELRQGAADDDLASPPSPSRRRAARGAREPPQSDADDDVSVVAAPDRQ